MILDCPTRWNSTYIMFMITLKFKAAFDRMANEDMLYDTYFGEENGTTRSGKRRMGPLESNDWENARRKVRFLRIFNDVTLAFFVSLRLTSSNCYNEIWKVEKALNSMSKNVDLHLKGMALSMKE